MLELKYVLDHPGEVATGAARKGIPVDVEAVRRLARKRKALSRRRSELGRRIRELGRAGTDGKDRALGKRLRSEASDVSRDLKEAAEGLRQALLRIPNLPAPGLPDEGEPRLEEDLPAGAASREDWDAEAGRRVSGKGAVVWTGDAARREAELGLRALEHFRKRGFRPVSAGPTVSREALEGAGFLPFWEGRLGKLADGRFLAPRPEAALLALRAGTRLPEGRKPLRDVACGWCYRPHGVEPGGRGFKLLQYRSVDLLSLETEDAEGVALARLVSEAETFLADLGLVTERVDRPAGNLSFSARRATDILARDGAGMAIRIGTVSEYGDFLARRSGIRISRGGHPHVFSAEFPLPRLATVLAGRS